MPPLNTQWLHVFGLNVVAGDLFCLLWLCFLASVLCTLHMQTFSCPHRNNITDLCKNGVNAWISVVSSELQDLKFLSPNGERTLPFNGFRKFYLVR